MGDIETVSHTVIYQGRSVYSSANGFLEKTASKERFKSANFMELALDFAADSSNRIAARRLNRIRHEADGISPTTYRNIVEREGRAMHEQIEQLCDDSLSNGGFVWNGEAYESDTFVPEVPRHIMQAEIENAAIELNIENYEAANYELPNDTVSVSIDEVYTGTAKLDTKSPKVVRMLK